MTCASILRQGQSFGKRRAAAILAPAVILPALAVTNDLHRLVYVPSVELSEFTVKTGTYSYGPAFWLLYVWMILGRAMKSQYLRFLPMPPRLPRCISSLYLP